MEHNFLKFSVIVPVYNVSVFLDRCVQSILSQTYKNFELLLIDDGSTDNSGEICDSYICLDDRVKVFHKPNGGVSSARNVGIENATGEWITFCDSDDWVLPTWLSNFCEKQEAVDLVCQGICFDSSMLFSHGVCKDISQEYLGSPQPLLDRMYELGVLGYVFSKSFKKSIISKHNIKFNEKLWFREDEDFVLRYMAYCKVVCCVNKVGYHYILPDFNNKYGLDVNGYELSKSLYQSTIKISFGRESKYSCKLKNDITSYFMSRFYTIRGYYQKRRLLLEYRSLLGPHLMTLNIFPITKLIIYEDRKGYISTILLAMHLKLKIMFKVLFN